MDHRLGPKKVLQGRKKHVGFVEEEESSVTSHQEPLRVRRALRVIDYAL